MLFSLLAKFIRYVQHEELKYKIKKLSVKDNEIIMISVKTFKEAKKIQRSLEEINKKKSYDIIVCTNEMFDNTVIKNNDTI